MQKPAPRGHAPPRAKSGRSVSLTLQERKAVGVDCRKASQCAGVLVSSMDVLRDTSIITTVSGWNAPLRDIHTTRTMISNERCFRLLEPNTSHNLIPSTLS